MGKQIKQPSVRKETWAQYAHDTRGGGGYVDAMEDDIPMLERILKRTSSYDELKKELTDFVKERKDFLAFVMNCRP